MSGSPAQPSGSWQQQDLLSGLMLSTPAADAPTVAAAETTDPSAPPVPVVSPTPAPAGPEPLPQTLLILDTETTGLDPEQDHCLEVGAILFHVPSRAVLSQISFLLPVRENPAEAINGIAAATTRLPQPWRQGLSCFEAMAADADAVLAHNAAFDRQWFGRGELPALGAPWICSMEDIRWPAERGLRPNPSVRDLALAYGVPVWAAHRALTDCIYLAQVLQRCEELEALLVVAREPRRLFRAQLSYAERHKAKQAGFRWNDPVPGAWSRRLSAREVSALPFPVVPVEPSQRAA
ncbi:exonuclease [Cyanobium sp. PCC 7001]|uniref:3'-5' exonuclease n=1 Tax=Cyanobium sp. PCC 7001 TaxID=180281 RepID=UPI00018049BB|nr:3'-5' exonuclease [Cyanobium sp. PCC 7001]EDY37159.1 exonuclease [Cyanobium sp. PCC 7001]